MYHAERMGPLALARRIGWLLWGFSVILFTWGTLHGTLAFIWTGYFGDEVSAGQSLDTSTLNITIFEVGETLATILIVSFVAYGIFKTIELLFYHYDEAERSLKARQRNFQRSYRQRLAEIEALETVDSLLENNRQLRTELTAIFEEVQRIKLEAQAVSSINKTEQKLARINQEITSPDLFSAANRKTASPKFWRKTSTKVPRF